MTIYKACNVPPCCRICTIHELVIEQDHEIQEGSEWDCLLFCMNQSF
jgi:hypothetical protein